MAPLGRSLLVLLLLGDAAQAQTTDAAEPKQEARRLSEQGIEAYERGDYLGALDLFNRAYAAYPAANLHYSKARVLSDLGRDLEALDLFERFLAAAKNPQAEFVGVAKARIAVLSQRVARLRVRCSAPDAEVRVDGKPIVRDPSGWSVRVNPGPHQVTANMAGFDPGLAVANPRPGEDLEIALKLRKAGPPPKPLVKRWWFWTAIAASAAVAATSIGVGVVYGTHDPSPGIRAQ